MDTDRHDTLLPRIVAINLAVSAVVLALLMLAAGLRISPWALDNLPYYLAGALAFAIYIGVPDSWRHGRAMIEGAEYYAVLTLTMLIGAVASYPVAALTHGYHDETLNRIDQLMGFDWLAWYRVVAAHPVLQTLGVAVYRSIYVTPALLLAWYAGTGQRTEAYRLIVAFQIAAILTLGGYVFLPAVGPFSYLWRGAAPYLPESEMWQAGLIPMLRAHELGVVDLAHLRGLVSAPSFHAAAAVLFINFAWRARALRWPLIALNVAMLVATPVEGTHYLIDLIIGAVVAGVALVATEVLARVELQVARNRRAVSITGG
ncbi:Inositolphosphotransferase Aur1/Ipt1 domain-containing protein [Sphingomonas antarctica]|uniref:phosphatase PAP2 family protein n=1 Tax=Sphingomonas antarctica TaxID=2040274 RepID=UPI0039ED78E1